MKLHLQARFDHNGAPMLAFATVDIELDERKVAQCRVHAMKVYDSRLVPVDDEDARAAALEAVKAETDFTVLAKDERQEQTT